MADTTTNLSIPLLKGTTQVARTAINAAFESIDQNALPLSHVKSGGHWAIWTKGKSYFVGDVIRTDDCYSWGYLQCTTAGTSGDTVPACPYGEGDTITDGTAIWTLRRIKANITNHEDLTGRNTSDQHPITAITGLPEALDSKQSKSEKGNPNGYPSLDANGRIPITQIPANIKEMRVIANIAARDALTGDDLYDGLRVRVLDARGDSTVSSGWAEYVYDATNTTWVKTAEKESMDVVIDWSNIQSIPDLLKALSLVGGKVSYNGTPIYNDVRALIFVGGDSEIIYPWAGTVQKVRISCSEPQSTNLDFSVEVQAKADYIAKLGNWQLVGGSQFTLPAGEAYKEFDATYNIQAGDVVRASTVGDDTGVTFQVVIKNN